MAEPVFSKPKQPRLSTDYSKCLICQKTNIGDSVPLRKVTEQGYDLLKTAIESRTDDVAVRLSSEIIDKSAFFLKEPKCHKSCKGNYASAKAIRQKEKKILVRQDSDSSTSSVDSESSVRSRSSTASGKLDFKTQCFICERARSKEGDRNLRYIEMKSRQLSVWEKAKALNDEAMLHKIQGFGSTHYDMVACDFRYHDKCIDRYLTQRVPSSKSRTSVTESPYDQAFEKLTTETDKGLFEEGHIYYVTTLRNRYREILKEFGVENVATFRNSSLVDRLNSFYNKEGIERIQIIPQVGSSSIVCSTLQNVGSLVKAISDLKSQLADSEMLDDDQDEKTFDLSHEAVGICFNAAKLIRTELKDFARLERKKLQESRDDEQIESDIDLNISTEDALKRTTNNLYNFVAWLVTEKGPEVEDMKDGRVSVNISKHEQILNLCQDITSAVTKLPTPKHVGIALHVLKETRSKEIVTMLNRFGNCISYTDAQRYLNTIATEADTQVERDGVFIPETVNIGNFTQFAIDNLDFHEHTKDGKTLHATTQNVYQHPTDPETFTPEVPGSVRLIKTRASSSKRTKKSEPSYEEHLSAKERQKGKSLSGVTLISERVEESSRLDDINLFWHFVRMAPTHFIHTPDRDITQPTWRTFNDILIVKKYPATIIGYGELIPKSPTDAAVVGSSLEYCMSVANKLGQEKTIVTCDQAIYEIALGLRKKHPIKFQPLILRMGGFHIASNFLGAIGYIMRSSGIEDLLSQAEVCLPGTAKKIMAGNDYYLMVRAHTLVATAMFELLWEALENWLIQESADLDTIAQLDTVVDQLLEVLMSTDRETMARVCSSNDATECVRNVKRILDGFRLTECSAPTAQFWLMYIDMINILKRFIQAERAGIWKEHLIEAEKMLPYLVVAGHSKYVSCLPQYLQEMRLLPTTAPEVATEFENGSFTIRRAPGRFNGVWTDMALEQSYNCDAKTELFHGISQKPETMEKYLRVIPKLTAISEQTKGMVHMEDVQRHHEDYPGVSKKENEAVQRIKTVVHEKMINPFHTQNSSDLLNISTGEKASSLELITAREKGIQILQEVQESEAEKVPNVHIKTFEDKKKRSQSTSRKIQRLYEDESSVARSLFFVQELTDEKKVEALSYEWTKYPASLFEPDEELQQGYRMRKGVKSVFYTALKDKIPDDFLEKEDLPSGQSVVHIIDAMAFIQKQQRFGCNTFHELQEMYMDKLISSKPKDCQVVNFVGDRYDFLPSKSLKQEEREKRKLSGTKSAKEYVPHDTLEVPDWEKISQNLRNKANLLNYIANSWMKNHSRLPLDLKVVIGGCLNDPGKTVEITQSGVSDIPELTCREHEEADTRMFAHAAYCIQNCGCDVVVFQATDTDVFVNAMYYSIRLPNIREVWLQKEQKCIAVHDIVSALSRKYNFNSVSLTGILLSVYILTGCDTVSYPFNKGKKRVLAVALDYLQELAVLGTMGEPGGERTLTQESFKAACKLFAILYGRADFEGTADDLRAHLYGHFKGDLRCLPPTEDAFRQHVLRALMQIIVTKSAHLPQPDIPDPTDYGRHITNDRLVATMMLKPAKPSVVTKSPFCKCRRGKCRRNCSCASREIRCTVSCLCRANPDKCGRIAQLATISDESD